MMSRLYFFLLLAGCCGLLGFGLYLEHAVGLEPCPLCILQRLAYIAIAGLALMGVIQGPRRVGLRVYSALLCLFALFGGGIAGRQVYLQHLPADQVPACGPDLSYMLDAFPWQKTVSMILSGSGECAEVQWQFYGLSIAEWSLFNFTLLVTLSILVCIFARRLTGTVPR